jgi:hypothetical protein
VVVLVAALISSLCTFQPPAYTPSTPVLDRVHARDC